MGCGAATRSVGGKGGGGQVRRGKLLLEPTPLFCSSRRWCLYPVFLRPRGSSGKTGSVRKGGHPGGGGRQREVLVVGGGGAGSGWWAAPRRHASLGLFDAGKGGVAVGGMKAAVRVWAGRRRRGLGWCHRAGIGVR